MKWGKHKISQAVSRIDTEARSGYQVNLPFTKKTINFTRDKHTGTRQAYVDYHDGDVWSNKRGLSLNTKSKTAGYYNTKNTKYYDEHEEGLRQKKGRLTKEYAEDGASYNFDYSAPKKGSVTRLANRIRKSAAKQITGSRIRGRYTLSRAKHLLK